MTLAQLRQMLPHMPFNALLGIQVKEVHDDGVTIECPIRPDLRNATGVVHGGASKQSAHHANRNSRI